MSRWAKAGVLSTVFEKLQRERLMRVRIEAVSLDSTIIKVHPDGMGAPKKTVPSRPLKYLKAKPAGSAASLDNLQQPFF
ncbi:Mobile element protein [Polaromonas sp. CG9_12]|nr:Mobile element protein [Polaromonas sp. CG9_12]